MSAFRIVKDRFCKLNEDFQDKYGPYYPSIHDRKGWEEYGVLQGLAFAMEKMRKEEKDI